MITTQFPTREVNVDEVLPPPDQPGAQPTVRLTFTGGMFIGGEFLPLSRYVTQLDRESALAVAEGIRESAANLPAKSDLAVVTGAGAEQAMGQTAARAAALRRGELPPAA